MDRKWIFISAFLHAALLLGVSVASRPALHSTPASLVVSLVSLSSVNFTGGVESTLIPGEPPAKTPVKEEAIKKPEPAIQQITAPDPESSSPLMERSPPDEEKTFENVPENTETAVVPEQEVEPANRITSPEITDDAISEDIAGNFVEESISVYSRDLVPQRQTSNVEPFDALTLAQGRLQTRFLAFSGDPSSLGGILAAGTGPGTGTGISLVRPKIISLPEPVYPMLSRRLGEEGRVILTVKISAEGGVRRAKIISSSSYPRLDKAAMEAIINASFLPALQSGTRVESERTVAYVFRLEEK